MPSYQEVLDADPAQFEACGEEFEGAAADLASGRERYRSHVDGTEGFWTGDDRGRLLDEAEALEREMNGVEASLGEHAAILKTFGPALALAVETLQHTDRELRDAGYEVDPAPRVRPGAAPTAPGPFGPALRALDEITAESATVLLKMMHRAVVVIDQAMAEALEAGELPAGRAQAILDEWEDIAETADTIRSRLVETDPWDVPPHAPAVGERTTEAALEIAARFAEPR
jgi:hypothetical protein